MKNQSLICIFCAALVLGLAACSGKSPTSSPGTEADNSASGIPHYQPDTFEGIPDDVTVHLPEAIPEDLRSGLEESLRAHGIPTGAKFVYYSLR